MSARGRAARASAERIPFRVRPMLATLVPEPFHHPGWVYEEKYDGYRILAYKEGDRVTLYSRNAKDRTATFPHIARALERLPDPTLLLDGEAVAFDHKLVSRFQLLQRGDVPYVYAVFDCLYRNGHDLRNERLPVRRQAVEEAIGDTDHLIPARRLASNGLKAYEQATKRGYEGVVGKDSTAPYVEGRSTKWVKAKVHQEEEFVIGGYTPPAGSRTHFGALLLGAYQGSRLRYVGKVGTGFTQKTLAMLHRKLQPLVRKDASFVDPPREKGAVWLAPRFVAQIRFQEWTHDWRLRQPVFLGLRDDKSPGEVLFPEPG